MPSKAALITGKAIGIGDSNVDRVSQLTKPWALVGRH